MTQTVLLVGATGTLGSQIAEVLLEEEVDLRLLVRTATASDPAKSAHLARLTDRGATLVVGDVTDSDSLEAATKGVEVVVSAVQGGKDVIVDGQLALAQAARSNGVRRFIPSDFALNIWEAPEEAPMFALRRAADDAIDELGLEVLHVLNGAFMDMMLDPNTAHVIDLEHGVANVYGSGTDEFDLTLISDIAAFTAKLAVDKSATAGTYAISGARTSFDQVIAAVEHVTGSSLARNNRGSIEDLRGIVAAAGNPWAAMGEWYNLSMLTTPPFADTSNGRYPEVTPTSLQDYLEKVLAAPKA